MASARAYFKGNIPSTQVFRGQSLLIINAMEKAIDAKSALTTAAIAKIITPALQTRQEPERVVAFYMSTWKKKGWVRVVDVEVSAAEAESSASAENTPHSVQDEVGGIHADQDAEIRMEVAVEAAHLPDLHGRKLSEAVVEVLKFKGEKLTAEEVTKFLNENGYEFQVNQVNSAFQNLLRKELVKKDGDSYELVA